MLKEYSKSIVNNSMFIILFLIYKQFAIINTKNKKYSMEKTKNKYKITSDYLLKKA